jgi:LPS export ABC transporter protein LptC
MKQLSLKLRSLILISILGIVSIMVLSCERKIGSIPKSDLLSLPSLTAKDFETVFKDSGLLQLIMTAPIMEKYDAAEVPYAEFTSGIRVVFYDGKTEPQGYVTAKYAKYTNTTFLWELKDSVVLINENNDKLETELLYWDQQKDRIYTDRFVKSSNQEQVIMGTGLESDSKMTVVTIKKVSATIPLKDEK